MSRDLTSGMVTAFAASTVRPFFLFEATFYGSTLRLWDGFGDLTWDSKTWLGNGWFKGQGQVGEDNDVTPNNLEVYLSGVPLALVSLLLSGQRYTNRGSLWVGCFDSSNAIIADPYLLFEGGLSAPRIDDSSSVSQIVLSYTDDLVNILKSRELRNNHESQQSLFPGDRGFEYVASLQHWTGFWGYREKPVAAATREKKQKAGRT